MIIEYPKLLNNDWLKPGCYIGNLKSKNKIYCVSSVVKKYGVKIKYKPYEGLISLSNIYYIPNYYINYYNNNIIVSEQFFDFFKKNQNRLMLKYREGCAQCNICKKIQTVIDYYGNGSFFCEDCKKLKNKISEERIIKYIDLKQPINYSFQILQLINLFSQICCEKMLDVNKVQKFIGLCLNILVNNQKINLSHVSEILNATTVEKTGNICLLKDSIFLHLGNCILSLHDGTKKQKYIYKITNELYLAVIKFIKLKNI